MKKILILNGPNLNLLGSREPAQYGHTTLADVEAFCTAHGQQLGYQVECLQSNWEGALIDKIHEYGRLHTAGEALGIVFNPGAFTHTSTKPFVMSFSSMVSKPPSSSSFAYFAVPPTIAIPPPQLLWSH